MKKYLNYCPHVITLIGDDNNGSGLILPGRNGNGNNENRIQIVSARGGLS